MYGNMQIMYMCMVNKVWTAGENKIASSERKADEGKGKLLKEAKEKGIQSSNKNIALKIVKTVHL